MSMENQIRQSRQKVIIWIMNIVIVVLCLLAVLMGYVAVRNLREVFSAPATEDSMFYCVDAGDFHYMVERYHRNEEGGFKGSKAMQEYYGVARYYEAASLYRAFEEAKDTERAEREKTRMEEALAQMGTWAVVKEEINTQLGID